MAKKGDKNQAAPPARCPNPADLNPLEKYADLIRKSIRKEYESRMRGKK